MLRSPLVGALGPEGGRAHCCSQESLPFRHRLQPDGSLVISPLRAEDAGTYSCGSTKPGRDSQKIHLRITGLCPPPPMGSHPHTGGARVPPWAKAS